MTDADSHANETRDGSCGIRGCRSKEYQCMITIIQSHGRSNGLLYLRDELLRCRQVTSAVTIGIIDGNHI
eukprot:6177110-Pleurochrysis_carterae.AAC.3